MSRLILASESPRRKELLSSVGVQFNIVPAYLDERILPREEPANAVLRCAEEKARAVGRKFKDKFILAADTVVVAENLPEDDEAALEAGASRPITILGKPRDENEAAEMLEFLQGREHLVITGFCLSCVNENYSVCRVVETVVKLMPLSAEDITAYVATGEPMGKAGGYAIQGLAGAFVESIRGSYSNVIGLPLAQTLVELESCGLWSTSDMVPITAKVR